MDIEYDRYHGNGPEMETQQSPTRFSGHFDPWRSQQ
jgi:hypothetical protein